MKKASKKKRVSEVLSEETKKMELKLQELKALMEKEKAKPKPSIDSNGNIWKSANTQKPIANYPQYIMEKHEEEKKLRAKKMAAAKKTLSMPKIGEQITNTSSSSQSNPLEQNKTADIVKEQPVEKLNEILAAPKEMPVDDNVKQIVPESCFPDVTQFLEGIGMGKYVQVFIQNGIEDMETILELKDNHFEIMKIPLGHKLKMLKRIKEISQKENAETTSVEAASTTIKNTCSTTPEKEKEQKKVRFDENPIVQQIENVNTNEKIIMDATPNLDIKSIQAKDIECKKIENNDTQPEAQKDIKQVSSTECETKMGEKPITAGSCCWHCYKLFEKAKGFNDPHINKDFCSEECCKKHREQNQIKCGLECCKNTFLKTEGYLDQGKWYCGKQCCADYNNVKAKLCSEEEKAEEENNKDLMNI